MSKLTQLRTGLTDARMGYIDKLNLTGKATDDSIYTSARATKIDNLDAAISTRAAASTALSNVQYTTARAARMDNIFPQFGKVKVEANALAYASGMVVTSRTDYTAGFSLPGWSAGNLIADRKLGYRMVGSNSTATDFDVLNVSGVSGWLLGVCTVNSHASTAYNSTNVKLTVDGTLMINSGSTSVVAKSAIIPFGWSDGNLIFPMYWMGIRFESSLRLQTTMANASLLNYCVYLLD